MHRQIENPPEHLKDDLAGLEGSVSGVDELGENFDTGACRRLDGPHVVPGLKAQNAATEDGMKECRPPGEAHAAVVEPVPVLGTEVLGPRCRREPRPQENVILLD